MAIVPEPENKSRKVLPVRSPRIANTDSLILSMAGLITPSGHFVNLPFNAPPVILIKPPYCKYIENQRISLSGCIELILFFR